ncbi:MAG: TonB-dependent receptor plug domain-containing protein [Gemmatimonadales bacterium]
MRDSPGVCSLLSALLCIAAPLSAQQPAPDSGKVHELPELAVKARLTKPVKYAETTKYDDFFRRQRLGFGTFFTREDIEKANAFHTYEIMRNVPGVRLGNVSADPEMARIKFLRCDEDKVAVYIDGQRQLPAKRIRDVGSTIGGNRELAEMLSRVSAPYIEMMEVYRGVGQIPGELNENACAVVAIWTRWNPRRWPGDTLNPA